MSAAKKYLTSTQKGLIAEHAVATALMLGSSGRLSVFMPLADDHGVDLIAYDKKSGKSLMIQVKSRNETINPRKIVHFEIRKDAYNKLSASTRKNLVLIAVLFDPKAARIKMAWLVPMNKVPKICNKSEKKYTLRSSTQPESADVYSEFRHDNINALVDAIQSLMKNGQLPKKKT